MHPPAPAITVIEHGASSGQKIVACPDCDLLSRLPNVTNANLICARCGAVLSRQRRQNSIEISLALTLTALFLFFLFPIVSHFWP